MAKELMLPNIPCGHSAQSSQLLNLQAHNLHMHVLSNICFSFSLSENKTKQQDSTKIKKIPVRRKGDGMAP